MTEQQIEDIARIEKQLQRKQQLQDEIRELESRIEVMRQQQDDVPVEPAPHCAGRCGRSDNLAEVTATPTPTGTYLLCPRCLADEEQQS